jgi:hypothetical protein
MVKLPGLRLSIADLTNQKLDGVVITASGQTSLTYTFPVMNNTYLVITDCLLSGTGATATLTGDGKTLLEIDVNGTVSYSPFTCIVLNLEKANTLTMTGSSGDVKANLYGFTYTSVK